jgi:hypothetical protein
MIRTGKREHDLTAHTLSWLGRPIGWMAGASAYLIGLVVAAAFLASALAAAWILIDTTFILLSGRTLWS